MVRHDRGEQSRGGRSSTENGAKKMMMRIRKRKVQCALSCTMLHCTTYCTTKYSVTLHCPENEFCITILLSMCMHV